MSLKPPRLVSKLPLDRLWHDGAYLDATKLRDLNVEDVRELLKVGRVQFVTADGGYPIQWIPLADCYSYWKLEVKPHLADPEKACRLDDFPDSYLYFGSEWTSVDVDRLILLERYH